jgi:hypothetical protein
MNNYLLETFLLNVNLVLSVSSIESELKKLEKQINYLKRAKKRSHSVLKCKDSVLQILKIVVETQEILDNSMRYLYR